jgi:hypothetical protein
MIWDGEQEYWRKRMMRFLKGAIAVLLIAAFVMVVWVTNDNNGSVNNTIQTGDTIETTEPTLEVTEPTVMIPTIPEPEYYSIKNDQKYIGLYVEEPQELNVFENTIDIMAWFDTFDSISEGKIAMCLDDHTNIALITLEPVGMTLRGIANGEYDEKIINYLMKLSDGDRVNTELFVRFAHEMEMRPGYTAWYTWQTYDPEGYILAWQHVVELGREYAPNVKWIWSPNRADEYTKAYYPGDEYVDYVGLTLNNTRTAYTTFGSFYEELGKLEYLEAYNKPIIFGEIAEHCYDDNQKKEYIASVFDYLMINDNIVGVVFLNKDIEYERQYQFSDNEEQLMTFIEKAKELKEHE